MTRPARLPAMSRDLDRQTCDLAQVLADRYGEQLCVFMDGQTQRLGTWQRGMKDVLWRSKASRRARTGDSEA